MEETAGVIGSCLQLYGAPIHVSGSVKGESARRGACSVKFSEASGGRGPFTKQRGVDIATEPGAWYGVYGGSPSAVRPTTQGVWISFRGEPGLLSRDEARTVDT